MQDREGYLERCRSKLSLGVTRFRVSHLNDPQIISAFHRRFPNVFARTVVGLFATTLAAPSRSALASLASEQRDKEESTRVARQRPVLRVCSEFALVGLIKDAPDRSGGEWIMKTLKELVGRLAQNDRLAKLMRIMQALERPDTRLTAIAHHILEVFFSTLSGLYITIGKTNFVHFRARNAFINCGERGLTTIAPCRRK